MRKFLVIFVLALSFLSPAWAEKISGAVKQDEFRDKNQVIDSITGAPVQGAVVSVPSKGYKVRTDKDGLFELKTNIDKSTILSVEKEGYRPFSLTIGKESAKKPMKLGIQQAKSNDLTIESALCHLGDDLFSDNSANSGEFKSKSVGPFYSKNFDLAPFGNLEDAVLVIGSIIGLDTKMAKELGQNAVAEIYSSPAEIFFNGQKIGELHINGDNQEIPIPRPLVRTKGNSLTVKTGRNLFQHAYIDYDDIEIMNIRIETKPKQIYADVEY